jgi:hypothetical protein
MTEEAARRLRDNPGRPTRCTVCNSPARAEVEFELSRHVPTRRIEKRHKPLNRDAIRRHARYHMPEALKKALKAKALVGEVALDKLRIEEGSNLLQRLVWARGKLHGLLAEAEDAHDINTALRVHAEMRANLRLCGHLLGEFTKGDTIVNQSLVVSPDYLRLRQGLLEALANFPDARKAVFAVMRSLETAPPITNPEVRAIPKLNAIKDDLDDDKRAHRDGVPG